MLLQGPQAPQVCGYLCAGTGLSGYGLRFRVEGDPKPKNPRGSALGQILFPGRPLINKPPPLSRDYNRDPYIKALKRRGFIDHGSTTLNPK